MAPSTSEDLFKVWASDNLVYGPVSLATLSEWVQEGRILPDTWVHRQHDNAWHPAGNVEALQPHFHTSRDTSAQKTPPSAAPVSGEELRQFPMFVGLSNAQLEQFSRFGEIVEAAPGEWIVKKGDPGDAVYFVLHGRVRVRLMVGFEEKQLGCIPAGEFFGEMALFNHTPRSADVLADSPVRLLRLSSQGFLTFTRELPEMAVQVLFAIAQTMAARIAESNERFKRDKASEFVWS